MTFKESGNESGGDVDHTFGYKDQALSHEIQYEIALETESNGVKIDADQLAFRVIRKHMPSFQKYDDFVTVCVWGHVRKMTGAELRNWRAESSVQVQDELPEFDRLQDYYESSSQEGNTVRLHRIRRNALSAIQRREIASGLRSKGRAYINHADQLDRETDELVAAGVLREDDE